MLNHNVFSCRTRPVQPATKVCKAPVLATLLGVMLMPALATAGPEDYLPLLYCEGGAGCWEGKSDLDADGVRALLGPDAPADLSAQTHTIVFSKGNARPVVSSMSPQDINIVYGGGNELKRLVMSPGDSDVSAAVPVFTPQDLGIDFEIPLFDPAAEGGAASAAGGPAASGMVPRDGMWRVTPTSQEFANCNPMMEQMLRGSGMMTTQNTARQINWGGRFDPQALDFLNAEGQKLVWTQVAPNRYTGKLFEVNGPASQVGTDVAMELISETEIASSAILDIRALVPDAAGASEMAALGLLDCKITMHFTLRHEGS